MKRPRVYISYGMTKSGSTLGFQLTKAILEQNEMEQKLFPNDQYGVSLRVGARINAIDDIEGSDLDALLDFAQKLGYPLAIKTHQRPSAAISNAVRDGDVTAHAIYRDPRDIALSMMDHGKRARASGEQPFAEIVDLATALDGIRHQTDSLAEWLRLPNVMPLCYDDIAFDSDEVAQKIAKHIGVIYAKESVDAAKTQFTQFNKGISDRYKDEMSLEDSTSIAEEFAPMIEKLIDGRDKLNSQIQPILALDEKLRIVV